jgi:7-cyano-7-deazaguanine reductase
MEFTNLDAYLEPYHQLEDKLASLGEEDPSGLLIAFPLAITKPRRYGDVTCSFDELTAFCPWTKFPDQGSIHLNYRPRDVLLELKSFKYYLLAFRNWHITQEHLAQKIFEDLMTILAPVKMEVVLDYMPRGGIHTVFKVEFP